MPPIDGGPASVSSLGVFGTDGAPGPTVPLWSSTSPDYSQGLPTESLARTGAETLLALAFPSCDGITSDLCTPNTIVVARVVASATSARVERVAVVPIRDPAKQPSGMRLLADGADETWLTWWEADRPRDGGTATDAYLYAMPLTAGGQARGPIESWFVVPDTRLLSDYFPTRAQLAGGLGTFYPVDLYVPADGGATTREVHVLHRQRDAIAPIEDVVVTTRATSFPAAVLQLAAQRIVVVATSTYPVGSTKG